MGEATRSWRTRHRRTPHRRTPRVRFVVPLVAASIAVLGACAAPPIETDVAADARRPDQVAAAPDTAAGDVLWGGRIVDARNGDAVTEIEVLAYPLDRRQRPMTGRTPEGRFLLRADGYLETVDYAPDRLVTVLGRLDGTVEGRIGEVVRLLPLVRPGSLHLWRPGDPDTGPRFTFGLGLGLEL